MSISCFGWTSDDFVLSAAEWASGEGPDIGPDSPPPNPPDGRRGPFDPTCAAELLRDGVRQVGAVTAAETDDVTVADTIAKGSATALPCGGASVPVLAGGIGATHYGLAVLRTGSMIVADGHEPVLFTVIGDDRLTAGDKAADMMIITGATSDGGSAGAVGEIKFVLAPEGTIRDNFGVAPAHCMSEFARRRQINPIQANCFTESLAAALFEPSQTARWSSVGAEGAHDPAWHRICKIIGRNRDGIFWNGRAREHVFDNCSDDECFSPSTCQMPVLSVFPLSMSRKYSYMAQAPRFQ